MWTGPPGNKGKTHFVENALKQAFIPMALKVKEEWRPGPRKSTEPARHDSRILLLL